MVKALLYSTLSTYFLVSLDSNYSEEEFQLFLTTEQIIAVNIACFACLFTTYNTNFILVYYFGSYWLSICISLAITALITFTGE